MKSSVIKRSIVVAGHKTSVSLEDAFWRGVKDIAASRRMTLSDLVCSIDTKRGYGNLSSAVRLFVLNHYQARSGGLEPSATTSRNCARAKWRRSQFGLAFFSTAPEARLQPRLLSRRFFVWRRPFLAGVNTAGTARRQHVQDF